MKKLIILLVCISCNVDYQANINNAIRKYKSGDIAALKIIESDLLLKNSVQIYPNHGLVISKECLYTQSGSNINILYPKELSFENSDVIKPKIISFSDDVLCVYNNNGISILGQNSDEKLYNFQIKNFSIKGLLATNNGFLYFQNFKIYSFNLKNKTNSVLFTDEFRPPYEKFYNASFYKADQKLFIIIGSAGLYNLNIVDLNSKNVSLKNFQISSSKIHIKNDQFIYVKTNSQGKYEIRSYIFNSKKAILLNTLSSIADIELFDSEYFALKNNKLLICEYDNECPPISLNYNLIGKVLNYAVIQYLDKIFLVNSSALSKDIRFIRMEIPGAIDTK
jgi:hypothetical protein